MTLVDIAALVFGLAAAYVFLTSVPDLGPDGAFTSLLARLPGCGLLIRR